MNDVEKSLFMLGRFLAGFFYILMGMNHFGNLAGMTAMVAEVGIPAPMVAVIVTGALLVLAGVSFLVGFQPPLGVLAAALFFVPVTLVMHDFWALEDPAARQQELMQFLRNIALLGSAMVFLAIPRPWPLSIDQLIQRRRFDKKVNIEETTNA